MKARAPKVCAVSAARSASCSLLTAIVAVGTAVIFIFNYPLLTILSEVGNAPQWGMFIGWAAVVTAGALVAFRKQFDRWRKQLAEDLT